MQIYHGHCYYIVCLKRYVPWDHSHTGCFFSFFRWLIQKGVPLLLWKYVKKPFSLITGVFRNNSVFVFNEACFLLLLNASFETERTVQRLLSHKRTSFTKIPSRCCSVKNTNSISLLTYSGDFVEVETSDPLWQGRRERHPSKVWWRLQKRKFFRKGGRRWSLEFDLFGRLGFDLQVTLEGGRPLRPPLPTQLFFWGVHGREKSLQKNKRVRT